MYAAARHAHKCLVLHVDLPRKLCRCPASARASANRSCFKRDTTWFAHRYVDGRTFSVQSAQVLPLSLAPIAKSSLFSTMLRLHDDAVLLQLMVEVERAKEGAHSHADDPRAFFCTSLSPIVPGCPIG